MRKETSEHLKTEALIKSDCRCHVFIPDRGVLHWHHRYVIQIVVIVK